ncbi:MAG: metallophosphoesterase [Myxococcota bacterium]|nr:metallophosphoesterase [Myxococcota bacterium]
MKRTLKHPCTQAPTTGFLLGFALLLASCGGEIIPRPTDTESDTWTEDSSSSSLDDETDVEEDTAAGSVVTTLLRTVHPVLEAKAQKASTRGEWGLSEEGAGEPFILREDLGLPEGAPAPSAQRSSLAFIWHATDFQIIDEESPARLIQSDDVVQAAFRLQESWSTQLLDAAVHTARSIHDVAPFDFALLTGDLLDNIQSNELDWLMTVLDGGTLHPDSGEDNDPLSGQTNDPHDPFEAAGMGDIPWYFTLGNHDDLILGNFSSLDWLVASPTGASVSTLSFSVVPTCLDAPFFTSESMLPQRCFVPDKGYYTGKNVVADENRAFIDRQDWVDALWGSSTLPQGHGLADEAPVFDYAVDVPKKGGPIRLVVLDTVAPEIANGALTAGQMTWLEQELRAAEDRAQLILVASHHPSWWIIGKGNELVASLHSSPNVIAHISGHVHKNMVVPQVAPKGKAPENGYYEIVTSSTLVWPQQTRLVEIVDNRDSTVSIFCTMLDYEIPKDKPVLHGGRFYGLYDVQAGSGEEGQGRPTDRNVELRIPIPQDVADKLGELPGRQVQSFRFPLDEEARLSQIQPAP